MVKTWWLYVLAHGFYDMPHVTKCYARKGQGQRLAQGLALSHMSVHMTI
jgi:hypothetical protein